MYRVLAIEDSGVGRFFAAEDTFRDRCYCRQRLASAIDNLKPLLPTKPLSLLIYRKAMNLLKMNASEFKIAIVVMAAEECRRIGQEISNEDGFHSRVLGTRRLVIFHPDQQ